LSSVADHLWQRDVATPVNPVSSKHEIYLVEVKAVVGESVKLLFTRELPPDERMPPKRCFCHCLKEGLEWQWMLLLGPLLRSFAAARCS